MTSCLHDFSQLSTSSTQVKRKVQNNFANSGRITYDLAPILTACTCNLFSSNPNDLACIQNDG